ncbi:MAG: nucleotide-binding protein [Planctomycetota bacterium]
MPQHVLIGPNDRLIMVVGNYGSGKTEVAVNLAIQLAVDGRRVQLADLDIVNPYFRSREARRLMEGHGVRVVVPPGAQVWADLPIILPEIQGMLHPPPGTVTLFDVGGDDAGAKALSSLRPALGDGPYELWQVINSRRPFTGTLDGCLEMQHAIEEASRLKVTGLLVNSHLIQHTTARTVLEGWRLALEVSQRSGRPVRCVAVMEEVAGDPALAEIDAPILRMQRHMLPPWLSSRRPDNVEAEDELLPAARPVPIGRPRPIDTPRSQGDQSGTNRD